MRSIAQDIMSESLSNSIPEAAMPNEMEMRNHIIKRRQMVPATVAAKVTRYLILAGVKVRAEATPTPALIRIIIANVANSNGSMMKPLSRSSSSELEIRMKPGTRE